MDIEPKQKTETLWGADIQALENQVTSTLGTAEMQNLKAIVMSSQHPEQSGPGVEFAVGNNKVIVSQLVSHKELHPSSTNSTEVVVLYTFSLFQWEMYESRLFQLLILEFSRYILIYCIYDDSQSSRWSYLHHSKFKPFEDEPCEPPRILFLQFPQQIVLQL